MGRVVTIGAVNRDVTLTVNRLPAAGETVFATAVHHGWGGKAANVACAAAALGAASFVIASVGGGDDGLAALQSLTEAGVDVAHVARSPHATGGATILLDPDRENCIVVTPGANGDLSPEHVEGSLTHMDLGRDDVVVVSGEVPDSVVITAITFAAARGSAVLYNASPVRDVPPAVRAAGCTLVVNRGEAVALAPEWDGTLGDDTLTRILELPVLLTLGADGAALIERGRVSRVASPPVVVMDTTGAGDAFLGGYADSLARRLVPLEALQVAAKAGAFTCSGPGARHHATPQDIALEHE